MKNIIKRSVYISCLIFIFSGIISCEKDFTDIGTTIIKNNVFSTDYVLVDLKIENKAVESFRTDNISIEPGQYLLGVYNNTDYEKMEASILSQVGGSTNLRYTEESFGADTTVVSTIDTVFLRLPYQVTLTENTSSGPSYELDSVFGNQNEAFTLNLYQSDEYLSNLNPQDPTKANEYFSNTPFMPIGTELNSEVNYQFTPNENDTTFVVKRRLSNSNLYDTDTITLTNGSNEVPLPFARIPLDESKFKSIIFNKYESPEFSSKDAFNNYFRGLIIEASGSNGSLLSLNFNNVSTPVLNPSIEVYYTNTVLIGGTEVYDTIKKNNSFSLSGLRRSLYKMEDKVYPVNEQIKIQGTAGSEGSISLFGPDNDNNGTPDQLEELRLRNVLVNDALLTIYIDQSADTTLTPERLYLYKDGVNSNSQSVLSHIKDIFTEIGTFGGLRENVDNKKTKYNFRITDYISDLLSSEIDYNPKLTIKALNTSDLILTDTIFKPFSWTPKAVTLLNESAINGNKKAILKISYSKKED